jgi:hypothetical protein
VAVAEVVVVLAVVVGMDIPKTSTHNSFLNNLPQVSKHMDQLVKQGQFHQKDPRLTQSAKMWMNLVEKFVQCLKRRMSLLTSQLTVRMPSKSLIPIEKFPEMNQPPMRTEKLRNMFKINQWLCQFKLWMT